MTLTVIISPGLGDSDANHWQTWLENCGKWPTKRVKQDDWTHPEHDSWMQQLQATIDATEGDIVLVGHSCGAVAITQWAQNYPSDRIKGAILVAPADVDSDTALPAITDHRPMSAEHLPFPTILICSDNDPHMTLERSHYFAQCWGSCLIELDDAGHINAESGFGPWCEVSNWIEELIQFQPEQIDENSDV